MSLKHEWYFNVWYQKKRCVSPGTPTTPRTKEMQKRTQTCARNITIATRKQLPGIPQEGPATLPEICLCTNRRTRRTATTQSTKSCTGTGTTKHRNGNQFNTQAKSFLEPFHPCTINVSSRLATRIDFKTRHHQTVFLSPDLPGSGPPLFAVMARARCCLALLRRLTLQKSMQRPTHDAN